MKQAAGSKNYEGKKQIVDCDIYLDLYMFDLTTKKYITSWLHQHPEARKWKDKYPECVFKDWGY